MIKGEYGYKGLFKISIWNKDKKLVREFWKHNTITDVMLDRLRDLISGDNIVPPLLVAFAVGSSTDVTPEDGTSTLLKDETAREAIGNNRASSTTGKLVTYATFDYEDIDTPPDINDNKRITEVGVFAMDGISTEAVIETTENTGLMISRIVIDELIPDRGTIQVTRIDEFRRVI